MTPRASLTFSDFRACVCFILISTLTTAFAHVVNHYVMSFSIYRMRTLLLSSIHTHTRTHTGILVSLDVDLGPHTTRSSDVVVQSLYHISSFPLLEKLHVKPSHPQLIAILSRAPYAHSLRELSIRLSTWLDAVSLADIPAFVSLRTLIIDGADSMRSCNYRSKMQLSDEDAHTIASLPHLERLDTIPPTSVQGMRSLCSCATLTSLTLHGRYNTPIEYLPCLDQLPRLSHLSLCSLDYGDTSRAVLCLSRLPSLTHLHLPYLTDAHLALFPSFVQIIDADDDMR